MLALSALVPPPAARAATLPAGFAETVVASGLANPTAMEFAPDGRLFVAEQGGRLRVIKNGALLRDAVRHAHRQLLGRARPARRDVRPRLRDEQLRLRLLHGDDADVHNRVSRFTANGDVAVAGSEVVILDLNPLSSATNHNGGAIHFGPDGKLYVAVGDNANGANAQTLTNLLGKMLRINADGSIPTDNPFFSQATGMNRAIWALGLRNPFTFAFQPGTGRMFINDVGQNTWEEINEGVAGANYGWPDTEGPTSDPRFRAPLYAYPHGAGTPTGCAITGGAFYNPQDVVQFPAELRRRLLLRRLLQRLDLQARAVELHRDAVRDRHLVARRPEGRRRRRALLPRARRREHDRRGREDHLRERAAEHHVAPGEPHGRGRPVGDVHGGRLGRRAALVPVAAQRREHRRRDLVELHARLRAGADNGARFRAVVTNAFGTATSNEATLTVTSNTAPVATITPPAAGTLYSGGQTINFAGTGTDAEDGTLPASAFTWEVVFHHDTHTHPFIAADERHHERVVRHPDDRRDGRERLVPHPPDGPRLGRPHAHDLPRRPAAHGTGDRGHEPGGTAGHARRPARHDADDVHGRRRHPAHARGRDAADVGGTTYAFQSWSDGGAAQHTISTPASNTTYTATFAPTQSGTGNGLSAVYYDNQNFTGATVSRVDPTVNFDWGTGSPAPGIGADTFSVRWTGQVQAQFSQTYTFYTTSDDGVRLWVNGAAGHRQLDRSRPDREQRHDRAHRRPAVRHQDGVLRERRRCRREALVEQPVDAEGDHSAEPALLDGPADRLRRQDQLPTDRLAGAGRIPEGRRRGVRRPRQRLHLRLERGDPRYT